MPTKSKGPAGALEKMKDIHEELFEKTDRLNRALSNLRYEGKANVGKNLKETWEILSFFEKELQAHVDAEEKFLFPFLEAHVPRLSPLISLFRAEHEDFRKNLKRFRLALEDLYGEKSDCGRSESIDKVKEVGTYLIYLLRQHLPAEEESVYKAIDHELHEEEREELEKLMTLNDGKRMKKAS